jgi:ABC-type transporter Mla subunit MlaD
MRFEGRIGRALGRFVQMLIRFFRSELVIRAGSSGLSIEAKRKDETEEIDARIAMLDQARDNLAAAIMAVNELKSTAEENKKDVAEALQTLSSIEEDKTNLESKVEAIRQIAQADVTTFRMLARVPSDKDILRERIIGFIMGVIASITAAFLIWGISLGLKWLLS